jgi:hypothetical protein
VAEVRFRIVAVLVDSKLVLGHRHHGELNENAAWYYPEPTEAAANITGRVAFWKGVKVE